MQVQEQNWNKKIWQKLVMKHCQNDSLCELFKSENLILEKFHEKISEYFELDQDTMPLEGVIRASIPNWVSLFSN